MGSSQEIERFINMLPGVLGARTDMADGVVTEVHVLASADRHPMQIVRDIESVVAAKLGIRLDRRIISVAQLQANQTAQPRLVLDTVQLKLRGDMTDIQVELTIGDARFVGTASGPTARAHRLRTAAAATLDAVQASLGGSAQFFVEEIGVTQVGDEEAVVLTVVMRQGSSEQVMVGCTLIWRDEAESAARATLSAINRRYERLRKSTAAVL